MPRRWLSIVILLALGCGGSSAVRPRRTTWIENIKLEGNSALDDDEVVPRLALDRTRRGGRAVDPYQLSLDTERVRQAYIRKGFFDVQVESRVIGETGPQTVVFRVVEGPRGKTRVSITGLPPEVPLGKARALVALEDGGPFDYEVYELAKEELTKLVTGAGYPYVELDAAVTVDGGVAIARYAFEAGPKCTFGEITVIGVPRSGKLHKAIRNRLEFHTGATFSTAALEATQRNLYEMGRFSTVHLEPDLGGDARVIPVRVIVTQGGRGELRLGGGGGYDSIAPEVRVRGGISHTPRMLPLWTFGVDARIALAFRELIDTGDTEYEWRVRALASGRRIDLIWPRITGDFGAGWDYLSFEAYTMTGPIAQAGLTFPLRGNWLQLRLGWSMQYQFFTHTSDALDDAARAELLLDEDRRLASYQQAVIAELRDSPTNPTKGAYVSMRVAEGTPFAGGEYGFLQLSPDVRLYYPLGPVVVALHGRAGTIIGDVPVTERYFAGGATSQRGFPFRQLAPSVMRTTTDGETRSVLIGGTSSIETSVELRATLGTIREIPVVASVFLDAADVFADNDEIGERPLHYAAGAGLGILLGGFKVRLDVGHRLNRTGPGEPDYEPDAYLPNTRFHLGIGDAF